jgi:hypothetical protein
MRYPKNQLKENLHTPGGEFIDTSNNRVYSGYYWELNGRYFVGKTASNNAIELKKATPEEIQRAQLNKTEGINNVSKRTILSSNANVTGIPANTSTSSIRYFSKQINVTPIIIKEINKDTFDSIKGNPLYQTISLGSDSIYLNSPALDAAERNFPGIKTFLGLDSAFTGEGESLDLATAIKIATFNAKQKGGSGSYTKIDEKISRLPNNNYKAVITLRKDS